VSDPEVVGEALDRFLTQMGSPPAKALGDFESRWDEVVGPVLATRTRPAEFMSGILTVICDDPAWASQITWSEGQIKVRISELFEGLELKRLKVKIDR
jgi:predicted nucleic acid-binding Zn ribbon protein